MTAEKFIEKYNEENDSQFSKYDCNPKIMIEFAKYHVKEALKQASEKARTKTVSGDNYHGDDVDDWTYKVVDKESILNSYPLENIK